MNLWVTKTKEQTIRKVDNNPSYLCNYLGFVKSTHGPWLIRDEHTNDNYGSNNSTDDYQFFPVGSWTRHGPGPTQDVPCLLVWVTNSPRTTPSSRRPSLLQVSPLSLSRICPSTVCRKVPSSVDFLPTYPSWVCRSPPQPPSETSGTPSPICQIWNKLIVVPRWPEDVSRHLQVSRRDQKWENPKKTGLVDKKREP